MFFAALLVYFFWKYAPSTLELEEGELQDSDDDDRSEDESNMFFPIQSKKVFMHSDSDSNFFPKDLNSSSTSSPNSNSSSTLLVSRDTRSMCDVKWFLGFEVSNANSLRIS